jgi:hypothetical protein
MVFDRVLENHIFAEIFVTLLPHLKSADFALFGHKILLNELEPLVKFLDLAILLFNQCFVSPVHSLTHIGVLALESVTLIQILISDAHCRCVRQVSSLPNFRGNVLLSLTTAGSLSSHVCSCWDIIVESLLEEFALVLICPFAIFLFDSVDITFKFCCFLL